MHSPAAIQESASSMEFLGVTGPSHCWACTNKLPTDPVNNLK